MTFWNFNGAARTLYGSDRLANSPDASGGRNERSPKQKQDGGMHHERFTLKKSVASTQPPNSASCHLAQNRLQNSAVPVVINLDRGVDACFRLEGDDRPFA